MISKKIEDLVKEGITEIAEVKRNLRYYVKTEMKTNPPSGHSIQQMLIFIIILMQRRLLYNPYRNYNLVTWLLQPCNTVIGLLQGCYKVVTRL